MRFLTDGTVDTTFGSGGLVNTNLGSNETINAISVLPNDKIIVAAQAGDNFALRNTSRTAASMPRSAAAVR